VSEEFSDNFDLTKTNRHSNFRSAIAPTMLFSLDDTSTKGILAYTFTANHDSFQNEMLYFHSVVGQFSWQATQRLSFTLADAFSHNDQPSEADSLGLRRQRATFTSNAFSLTSDYVIDRVETREYYRWNTFSDTSSGGNTTSTSGNNTTTQAVGATALFPLYTENTVTLTYEYLTSHTSGSSGGSSQGNNQTLVGSQDVNGHQVTASMGHMITPQLTIGLSGDYAFRTLSGDTTTAGNFQLWSASLFGTYGTTPFRITGKTGLAGLTSDSGGSRGPDLTLSATASYTFARTIVSLALEHGFSETFSTGENFGVVETTGVTAGLSYAFTPRTSGTVNAYYRKSETTGIGGGQNFAGGSNIGSNKSDVNEGVGASAMLSVYLARWLRLNLTYTYTQLFDNGATTTQGTDNSNAGYTENRVRISFDFTF